jgi:Predicted Zn peptidase
MDKVLVNPDLLKWAVRRSNITDGLLKRKFPKYEKWLNGIEQPTFKQLEKLAAAVYVPIGFMFLKQPPKENLPVPYYRTITPNDKEENISCNLMDTIQTMQLRQEWMREYLINKGAEPIKFIASKSSQDEVEEVANAIRKVFSLERTWAEKCKTWTDALNFLRQTMEAYGILVVVNGVVGNNTRRVLNPKEFRGFVLADKYAPLVFVNGADAKSAQMFTLAHEIAHLFLGESAIFDLEGAMPSKELIEIKCDQIAAEFLVPGVEFKSLWSICKHQENYFQCMARQFKVSELVIARRALDLGVISRQAFFDFYNTYKDEIVKAKKGSGGDFYLNQNVRIGKRFATSVIQATLEGKLLYSEAYRLTGLKGNTFTNFAGRLGYEV